LNSKVSADDEPRLVSSAEPSTHRSIIGRSTAQHMIRTVVLIHLGVIWSRLRLRQASLIRTILQDSDRRMPL
jgi:hypothetical protein